MELVSVRAYQLLCDIQPVFFCQGHSFLQTPSPSRTHRCPVWCVFPVERSIQLGSMLQCLTCVTPRSPLTLWCGVTSVPCDMFGCVSGGQGRSILCMCYPKNVSSYPTQRKHLSLESNTQHARRMKNVFRVLQIQMAKQVKAEPTKVSNWLTGD